MMVPNRSSDSSSNRVACWPADYDKPAICTIEALTGLNGTKGELHSGYQQGIQKHSWPCLAYSEHLTSSQP